MRAIESNLEEEEYVTQPRSVDWLRCYDALKETGKAYFTYSQVRWDFTRPFGIPDDEVDDMLMLLNDMGMLWWNEEESLRDYIIMDPLGFFVKPVTNIICKHSPNFGDPTMHHRPIFDSAKRSLPDDFADMTDEGIVSQDLLSFLLSECGPEEDFVTKLMIKYGLVLPYETLSRAKSSIMSFDDDDKSEIQYVTSKSYLVPALLKERDTRNGSRMRRFDWKGSFYIYFTTSLPKLGKTAISIEHMKESGFFPSGLFERLICKATKSSLSEFESAMLTKTAIDIIDICKDSAVLQNGTQRFQLTSIREWNCIKVDFEGEHAWRALKCIMGHIEVLISECMKSLKYVPLLLHDEDNTTDGPCHIDLREAKKAVKSESFVINRLDTAHQISGGDIRAQHKYWFDHIGLLDWYDVFISHRWYGNYDDKLAKDLYQRLFEDFELDVKRKRPIRVFLDHMRLGDGSCITSGYSRALINSRVSVPIVSRHSLTKMAALNSKSDADDVLVEWIISLQLAKLNKITIFPILIGSQSYDVITSLFDETDSSGKHAVILDDSGNQINKVPILNTLPVEVPVASIALAKSVLRDSNVSFDEASMDKYTVKSIVLLIADMIGYTAWKEPGDMEDKDPAKEVPDRIWALVSRACDANAANSTSSNSSGGKSSSSSSIINAISSVSSSSSIGGISNSSSNRVSINPRDVVDRDRDSASVGMKTKFTPDDEVGPGRKKTNNNFDGDLRSFLESKNLEYKLKLSVDDIENMLRVLDASKVRSREAFFGLTLDDLNEVMTSCQPPLPIGLRGNLRAIYNSKI